MALASLPAVPNVRLILPLSILLMCVRGSPVASDTSFCLTPEARRARLKLAPNAARSSSATGFSSSWARGGFVTLAFAFLIVPGVESGMQHEPGLGRNIFACPRRDATLAG